MSGDERVVPGNIRSPLTRPWIVTAGLGAALVVLFIGNTLVAATTNQSVSGVFGALALTPIFVDEWQLWRVLTSSLLHTSVWTLLATLLALVLIGREIEARWGGRKYLAAIGIVALGSSTAAMWVEPRISRFALGPVLAVGLAAAALVVARRAGYRVWAIATVGVLNAVLYVFLAREVSKVALLAGALVGALVAFLLVLAPADERRDRYHWRMLGGLTGALVLFIVLHAILD